jgi:hypothetical protein
MEGKRMEGKRMEGKSVEGGRQYKLQLRLNNYKSQKKKNHVPF